MSAALVQRISATSAFQWPTSLYIRSNLRSAQRGDMVVPRTRTIGRRSFHVAAPLVWNALPAVSISALSPLNSTSISRGRLRAGMKTHLFIQAYDMLWEQHLCFKSILVFYLLTYLFSCGAEAELSRENWMSGSGAVSGVIWKRCEQWAEISTSHMLDLGFAG